jgi:hypothetical protein
MGASGLNDSGDLCYFHGANNQIEEDYLYLYRALEDESFDLVSLLDDASKAEYLAALAGRDKMSAPPIWKMSLSDDNLAFEPAQDPFDTIAGTVIYPSNYPASRRAFILTPVELAQ